MWKIDTGKKGRWALFKPYEWELFNYATFNKDKEFSTKDAHLALKEKVSRASIIIKLQEWAKQGLLATSKTSGKGGIRDNYIMIKSRVEAEQHIANLIIKSLNEALKSVIVGQAYVEE